MHANVRNRASYVAAAKRPASGAANLRARFRAPCSGLRTPTSPLTPHAAPLTLRRGISLLELLAVIIIIVTVTAATIPTILPALANRRVREASRMVNVFFAGARNRALQTGRPVGVMLERFNGLPDAAMTLSYCEVPPPYAGDFSSSKLVVESGQITRLTGKDVGWDKLVRVGDVVKFNYQGHLYRLTGPDANNDGFIDNDGFQQPPMPADALKTPWTLVSVPTPGVLPPNSSGSGVPFQIYRAPGKLASGSIQLPEGIVIDMAFSGFDWAAAKDGAGNTDPKRTSGMWTFQFNPNKPNDSSPVAITFTPGGSVDKIWCYDNTLFSTNPQWGPHEPVTPIHLLIGRRELLPLTTAPKNDPNKADYNWQDPTNLWVSINVQTGLVATAENAVPTTAGLGYQPLIEARRFARESHTMGGR